MALCTPARGRGRTARRQAATAALTPSRPTWYASQACPARTRSGLWPRERGAASTEDRAEMVKIRLMRMGMKGAPTYRIVIADARSPRDGRIIENIGWYNPRTQPSTIVVDAERAKHWLGVGAQPSASPASPLRRAGVLPRIEPEATASH